MAGPPNVKKKEAPAPIASGELLPLRIVVNGVEGVGKTTFGAYAPQPVFLCARDETGLQTLSAYRRIPAVDNIVCESWSDSLNAVDGLVDNADYQTVVIDAIGGFERLCHEHVCNKEFGGDWGERGFLSFHKGFEISVAYWLNLLQKLDKLRAAGKWVVLLSHVAVRQLNNPMGANYDRYVADIHSKTWGVTHKWADAVLFYTFFSFIDNKTKKPGDGSGTTRIIYTERTDAYDAKNRIGLPNIIDVDSDPADGAKKVWSIIRKES